MIGVVALTSVRMTVAAAELEFDHVWIVVIRDGNRAAQLRLVIIWRTSSVPNDIMSANCSCGR